MQEKTSALFGGPNYGHVATVMSDGSPHSVPVWVGLDGDRVLFHKEIDSVARRNLARDPRVAISVVATDDPYRCAWIRGRVVEFRDDPYAARWLNDAAVRYTGRPYPPTHFQQLGPGTVIVVEPERDASMHISFLKHAPSAH